MINLTAYIIVDIKIFISIYAQLTLDINQEVKTQNKMLDGMVSNPNNPIVFMHHL